MRRIWIVLIVAGLLILGCSKTGGLFPSPSRTSTAAGTSSPKNVDSPHKDLTGLWHVFYSWGCGSLSETTWILNPDGTFYAPAVNRGGTWKVEESKFTLMFPYDPFIIYTGEVDLTKGSMEGTMAGNDGSSGCWHARKAEPAS